MSLRTSAGVPRSNSGAMQDKVPAMTPSAVTDACDSDSSFRSWPREGLRETEVEHFGTAFGGHDDVGGL